MPFYIRRSVRVGPFRFNLSKSGVGLSVGVRGLRVGSGPRGNYVHMGRHGVYYRQSLGRRPSASGRGGVAPVATSGPAVSIALREVETAPASALRDASSADILEDVRRKRRATPMFPIAAASLFFLFLFGLDPLWQVNPWAGGGVLALGIGAAAAAYYRDQVTRTLVLVYNLDARAQDAFEGLCDRFDELAACERTEMLEAEGNIDTPDGRKRHSGATQLIQANPAQLTYSIPRWIQTNVPVPVVLMRRQRLCLFPDRILVLDDRDVGAIAYEDLEVEVSETRRIEDGHCPSDATVVGSTWRYVNKDGSPDRRFRDNVQLPIIQHSVVGLRSSSGAHYVLYFSRQGVGDRLAEALEALREVAAPAPAPLTQP